MNCATCGCQNPEGVRFCTSCGVGLVPICKGCGFSNPVGARFCGQCALPLGHDARQTTLPVVEERRQLTVLFCDLVSASTLAQQVDPEDFRDILRDYHALCGDVVRKHDGYVAQYMGDGLLVYFGYPAANDDTPQRAVRAGLALLQAMRRFHPTFPTHIATTLHIRVGIHTGAVVLGEMGDHDRPQRLAIGESVHMAERVQRAASPDSVLVSEATYRLTRGFFNFSDLGPHELKGFSQPVSLYEATGETGVRSRLDAVASVGLSPFVGRDDELALLLSKWDEAQAGGGPVVLMGGEAGIGKSRIARVLKEHLEQEHVLTVECFSSPYFQNTPLYPIIEMLERRMGFTREVGAAERVARIEKEVARAGLPVDTAVPLLGSLLSIPSYENAAPLNLTPQRQRHATFDLLATWLMQVTKAQPVLFIVEDLHWADPSTLEFLAMVMDLTPSGSLMTLLIHRPEFKDLWQSDRLTRVNLGRLSLEGSQKILGGITGHRPLPTEVTKHVLSRADGVPLFVEEITKAVLESGVLREREQGFELVASATALLIPSTVQDSLTARLDRLGSTKAVAQIAATIGRTFTFDLLHAVSGLPETTLHAELERLIEAGLIFSRGGGAGRTFIFKHALIQDAAYESLLRSTRQRFHQQIARTLTEQFPEVAATQPELLAQHYAGAGLARDAIEQWARAGQREIARSSSGEAIVAFTEALKHLMTLNESDQRDRKEIELRAGLGLALISTRGFSSKEVEETYARARELCEKFGDVPVRVLFGVWAVQIVRGDRDATARLAEIFQRLAGTSRDRSECLIAHACLATRAFYAADYDRVHVEADRGKELCDAPDAKAQNQALMRDYGYEGLLYSHLFLAWTDAIQGRLEQCRGALHQVLEIAERTDHAYVLAMALGFGAAVWRDIGDGDVAAGWAARSISLCQANGFAFWLAGSLCVSGWMARGSGDKEAGTQLIGQGAAIFRQMGALITLPYYLTYLIESHLQDGRIDQGLDVVAEALGVVDGNLARNHEPELLRLKGQLLLAKGAIGDAETQLRASLRLSRDQAAALFAIRSGVALGRLLIAENRRDDARALLVDVRGQSPRALLDMREGQALAELLASIS